MSRSRPRAAASRPRARTIPTIIPPTPRRVVGTIEWDPQIYTLAEMKQKPPKGGGIYIIARPAQKGVPVSAEHKPIIPIYVGEAGNFRERWTRRFETFGHLFGSEAASVLNALPFSSFGVYIGRFPSADVRHLKPRELTSYREDVEWVLIRHLKNRFTLNQTKKMNLVLLSQVVRITNEGARPGFLGETIEVAEGSTLELSMNELRAEPWQVAREDKGASSSGNWFRRDGNIVVLLDA